MNNPLAALKDIHSPPPVSWWPLAPGWYVLIGLIVALFLIGTYIGYQYWHKKRRKQRILAEIQALRNWLSTYTDKQYVASQLSILLKRVLFITYSREMVAGLYDEEWLLFLDKVSGTTAYSQGCGRLLVTAPYASQTDDNMEDLFRLIERTIRGCL